MYLLTTDFKLFKKPIAFVVRLTKAANHTPERRLQGADFLLINSHPSPHRSDTTSEYSVIGNYIIRAPVFTAPQTISFVKELYKKNIIP